MKSIRTYSGDNCEDSLLASTRSIEEGLSKRNTSPPLGPIWSVSTSSSEDFRFPSMIANEDAIPKALASHLKQGDESPQYVDDGLEKPIPLNLEMKPEVAPLDNLISGGRFKSFTGSNPFSEEDTININTRSSLSLPLNLHGTILRMYHDSKLSREVAHDMLGYKPPPGQIVNKDVRKRHHNKASADIQGRIETPDTPPIGIAKNISGPQGLTPLEKKLADLKERFNKGKLSEKKYNQLVMEAHLIS